MACRFQPEGPRFVLGMLAGSGDRINGMYIEYGLPGQISDAVRNRDYFKQVSEDPKAGYVRAAVTGSEVRDGAVMFTATLMPGDVDDGKIAAGMVIKKVTLACFKSASPSDDVFIYTADVPSSALVPGAMITVTAGMRLIGA